MNKYFFLFLILCFPSFVWGISSYTETYPDDLFLNINPGTSFNGFYSDLLAKQNEAIPVGNINQNVSQHILLWKKAVATNDTDEQVKVQNIIEASQLDLNGEDPVISKIVTEDRIEYLIQVKIGSLLNLSEISTICSLSTIDTIGGEPNKIGYSYTDLFSNKEQLYFSGQIQAYCEEEKELLRFKRDISMEVGIEGLFNDTRTDNSPFEITTPLANLDSILHGSFASGGSVSREGGDDEFIPSAYPLVSWAYKDKSFDPLTGFSYNLNPYADPSAPLKESDNESIDLLPDLPPSILAQKNSLGLYQDSREIQRNGCHTLLEGDCGKEINDFKKTENTAETQDPSWLGMIGRMSEKIGIMNNHALSGGVTGKSFGELTFPQSGNGRQFLSHDPGETINVHYTSYAESESSNSELEVYQEDIVGPYDIAIQQLLTQSSCGQYKPLRNDSRSALYNIGLCNERRSSELKQYLFDSEQAYKQKTVQQGIEKKTADAEQLNTELQSMQKRMEEIEKLFKDLNSKKRIS